MNGGHVVALVREGDQLTYVSVHGHEHVDVALAMLVDLLTQPLTPGSPTDAAGDAPSSR